MPSGSTSEPFPRSRSATNRGLGLAARATAAGLLPAGAPSRELVPATSRPPLAPARIGQLRYAGVELHHREDAKARSTNRHRPGIARRPKAIADYSGTRPDGRSTQITHAVPEISIRVCSPFSIGSMRNATVLLRGADPRARVSRTPASSVCSHWVIRDASPSAGTLLNNSRTQRSQREQHAEGRRTATATKRALLYRRFVLHAFASSRPSR